MVMKKIQTVDVIIAAVRNLELLGELEDESFPSFPLLSMAPVPLPMCVCVCVCVCMCACVCVCVFVCVCVCVYVYASVWVSCVHTSNHIITNCKCQV